MDGKAVEAFIRRYAELIAAHKEELTQLDAAIGDADHGTNMDRGMKAALEKLPSEGTPGDILKAVAMALISHVGGAAGPLYGTAFLRASQSLGNDREVSPEAMARAFAAALKGIQDRGKAVLGDKTMVDAFQPAVEAMEKALQEGKPWKEALQAAYEAAKEGSDATIPLVARKGRASYLGERSAGHRDPGSLSTALLFEAALILGDEP
ncbi:MAG: dihydroxyacetone kinase subunit L [Clostridiales bacterium]|nr:dihydroxyacetone kinase subunit L [Clostridiales bacterium]